MAELDWQSVLIEDVEVFAVNFLDGILVRPDLPEDTTVFIPGYRLIDSVVIEKTDELRTKIDLLRP